MSALSDRFARGVFPSTVIALSCGAALGQSTPRFATLSGATSTDLTPAAYDLSRDGHTVVGSGHDAYGQVAMRWVDGVVTPFQPYVPVGRMQVATAVSADGSVIAGESFAGGGPRVQVWRAMPDDPIPLPQYLPYLAGAGTFNSLARGISDDGRWLVGESHAPGSVPGNLRAQACVWDTTMPSTAPTGLGYTNTEGTLWSDALGISADGNLIVGEGRTAAGFQVAAVTTRAAAQFSVLPGISSTRSSAFAISNDGGTVLWYDEQYNRFATRNGLTLQLSGSPAAMTSDGSILAGALLSGTEYAAAIWLPDGRAIRIDDVLRYTYGVDLTGWKLQYVSDISGDGTVVLGGAQRLSDGVVVPFVATIPAPAGSTMVLGVAFVSWARRRRA